MIVVGVPPATVAATEDGNGGGGAAPPGRAPVGVAPDGGGGRGGGQPAPGGGPRIGFPPKGRGKRGLFVTPPAVSTPAGGSPLIGGPTTCDRLNGFLGLTNWGTLCNSLIVLNGSTTTPR